MRTIEIFDVDWLKGMSVGRVPDPFRQADQGRRDLEKVFGEQSKSPVAGMFRFLPLEGANAVLVITRRRATSTKCRTGSIASPAPRARNSCSPTS
jgi:general secretion pathway protein D